MARDTEFYIKDPNLPLNVSCAKGYTLEFTGTSSVCQNDSPEQSKSSFTNRELFLIGALVIAVIVILVLGTKLIDKK